LLRKNKVLGIFLAVTIVIICIILDFYNFFDFPREVRLVEGKQLKIELGLPFTFELFCPEDSLTINGLSIKDKLNVNLREPMVLQSSKLGTYDLEFRWLGVIPVKKMRVFVMPETRVVPGGHSVGVKLRPNGVIIVGFAPVTDEEGNKRYPAQEAGLEIGDTIYMVNHQQIDDAEELSRIINNDTDKIITLSIRRDGSIFETNLQAVKSSSGTFQIGLWVRDIAAGVGTMSFYDPNTGYYGALGHMISDADTGKYIEVGEGEIIRARVTSITPGRKSQPGEKRGVFVHENNIIGNIAANTRFGIYGKIYRPIKNPYYSTLPVATVSQVQEGPAEILTVIEDEKIEAYEIEIQKIFRQSYPSSKGMIIKITDPELLRKTGGIIQGMSGSPIIQNGYLVGAVTHVFVNDPTRGYAIFAEWMMEEILKLNSEKKLVQNY